MFVFKQKFYLSIVFSAFLFNFGKKRFADAWKVFLLRIFYESRSKGLSGKPSEESSRKATPRHFQMSHSRNLQKNQSRDLSGVVFQKSFSYSHSRGLSEEQTEGSFRRAIREDFHESHQRSLSGKKSEDSIWRVIGGVFRESFAATFRRTVWCVTRNALNPTFSHKTSNFLLFIDIYETISPVIAFLAQKWKKNYSETVTRKCSITFYNELSLGRHCHH